MKHWDITTLTGLPGRPQVLSTSGEARAIAIGLAAGQRMGEHQVHERAWVSVVTGEVELVGPDGAGLHAGPGAVFELEPRERHTVVATTECRMLLLLAPWPGVGHPTTRSEEFDANARQRASARNDDA
jgi:quercetin dioxygenase-like cupin family protein